MKKILEVLRTIQILIFGWGIAVPLVCLFPLKKNLVLFIGKGRGLFFDNIKYFYLYVHNLKQKGIEYYFVTEKKPVYDTLKKHNLPVLLHPSFRSKYAMMRAKTIILCCTWHKNISLRAKKVQLWHGVPLKKICMLVPEVIKRKSSFLNRISDAIRGKNYYYDLFISTSGKVTEIFSKAVKADLFIESGYPRNDIFFKNKLDEDELIGADTETIGRIDKLRADGLKSVLYAPTLDYSAGNPVKNGLITLENLSAFAVKHKYVFVFKFHPSIHCEEFGPFDNIIYYDNTKDIQPLLKSTDILITDYSSVYIDFLLLDRPIIFFPHNYQQYIKSQEGLLFDYDYITPGPKCYSQDQIQETLAGYAANQTDNFAAKREEIRKLTFKYQDGKASERIWNFIMKEFIKSS